MAVEGKKSEFAKAMLIGLGGQAALSYYSLLQ